MPSATTFRAVGGKVVVSPAELDPFGGLIHGRPGITGEVALSVTNAESLGWSSDDLADAIYAAKVQASRACGRCDPRRPNKCPRCRGKGRVAGEQDYCDVCEGSGDCLTCQLD